jgi:ABC-2 type transport system permease protein
MATAVATPTLGADDPLRATRPSPPSLTQAVRLARYQLRDYLYSRRFILMMAIVAIIGVILTALVGYFRPASLLDSSNDFYDAVWAGGITIVFVFAGVIFGGDAIAGEFQNKTGYFLMGLPVRRATVYVGKYLAAFTASLVAVLAFALILVGNAVFYFGAGAFTLALGESFLLALTYMLALLGATFMFSSMFKTSTYAVLVVAVLFIFGFSVIQELVTALWRIEPWFLITYSDSIIGYPFLSTLPPHISTMAISARPGAPTLTMYNPTYAEGIAVMLGYFVLTALGGLGLFELEEFT